MVNDIHLLFLLFFSPVLISLQSIVVELLNTQVSYQIFLGYNMLGIHKAKLTLCTSLLLHIIISNMQ